MRNRVCLLATACLVPLLGVGVAGCQRDISDEQLGRVITDLSQVPGTAEPYELNGGGEKTPAEPSGHDLDHGHAHGQPLPPDSP